MSHNIYIYLLIAALTIYVIRALPLTLIRKDIQNKFIRSFLYYVPYVTLSVMTFPAILSATNSYLSGIAAFVAALIAAWISGNLFKVALSACIVVYVIELFIL